MAYASKSRVTHGPSHTNEVKIPLTNGSPTANAWSESWGKEVAFYFSVVVVARTISTDHPIYSAIAFVSAVRAYPWKRDIYLHSTKSFWACVVLYGSWASIVCVAFFLVLRHAF